MEKLLNVTTAAKLWFITGATLSTYFIGLRCSGFVHYECCWSKWEDICVGLTNEDNEPHTLITLHLKHIKSPHM